MSNLKISANQFLEKEELNRLVRFLTVESWKRVFDHLIFRYGILAKTNQWGQDESFEVTQLNSTSITVKGDSAGYDRYGNIFYLENDTAIPTPDDPTDNYYITVKHKETNLEKGTVIVDSAGNMSGNGTMFTEVLRGQPNFPTKIKVFDGSNYSEEFEVLRVLSDTTAILQGNFGTGWTAAQYLVVGTFDHAANIPSSSKNIYTYDSCEIKVYKATVQPVLVSGAEFMLATVKNTGGVITITDHREDVRFLFVNRIDTRKFLLTNRDNHIEKLMIQNISSVIASFPPSPPPGTLWYPKDMVLLDAETNIIDVDTDYLGGNIVGGFRIADDKLYEVGTKLTLRNVGTKFIYLKYVGTPTSNPNEHGFVDYARWRIEEFGSTADDRKWNPGETIEVMLRGIYFDGTIGNWRGEWEILSSLKNDMEWILKEIKANRSQQTTVFYGINADVSSAKEGDIWYY